MKKISTLVGLVIIIILAVILVGGAFAYQYLALKNRPASQMLDAQNKNLQKPTEPFGWKTYTSEKFGYSIKYPSDWTFKEETPGSGQYVSFRPSDASSLNQDWPINVSMNLCGTDCYIPLTAWLKITSGGLDGATEKTIEPVITSSGMTGYKATFTGTVPNIAGPGAPFTTGYETFFENLARVDNPVGGKIYENVYKAVEIDGPGKDEPQYDKYLKIYNQMISTVKIIDSTALSPVSNATTDGWQTYTNNTYGFQMKYPAGWDIRTGISEKAAVNQKHQFELGLFSVDINKNSYDFSANRHSYIRVLIMNKDFKPEFWPDIWSKFELGQIKGFIGDDIHCGGSSTYGPDCSDPSRIMSSEILFQSNAGQNFLIYVKGDTSDVPAYQMLSTFKFINNTNSNSTDLSGGYSEVGNKIYFSKEGSNISTVVPVIDVNSFSVYDGVNFIAMDNRNVYSFGQILENADPRLFTYSGQLGGRYFKDKYHVWYMGPQEKLLPIVGADPATFECLYATANDDVTEAARDANHTYSVDAKGNLIIDGRSNQ